MAGDFKQELSKLHEQGAPLLRGRKRVAAFEAEYQRWYSAASPVVKRVAPARHRRSSLRI